MNTEYDFFDMGIRYATEGLVSLKKCAAEIGEKFGENAKLEFESGIASTIPTYSSFQQYDVSKIQMETASTDFGVPNQRNNSYFGTSGISNKFKTDSASEIYNEPPKKR